MPQPYRGGPDGISRFTLADGRTAVHVPREKTDYSGLHRGYPLAEGFLDHLSEEGVDAIAIDDGEQIYVFARSQYRWGSRVGHAPYPMKRVVPLDEATVGLRETAEDGVTEASESHTDGTSAQSESVERNH